MSGGDVLSAVGLGSEPIGEDSPESLGRISVNSLDSTDSADSCPSSAFSDGGDVCTFKGPSHPS